MTTNAGTAYVFVRTGTTWMQEAYVKASNTGGGDNFGYALALSAGGNLLAVGAHHEQSSATGMDGDEADDSLSGAGAVYVFSRSAGVWAQEAYVKASNTSTGARFGWSVSPSETNGVLAVGAHQESSTVSNAGAVYVFTR